MFNASSLPRLSLTVGVSRHDLQGLIFSPSTPRSRPDISTVRAARLRGICTWVGIGEVHEYA